MFLIQNTQILLTILVATLALGATSLHGYITACEDNGVALKAGRAPRIAIKLLAVASITILAIL